MEVHETSWPLLNHGTMPTAATRGDCVTESSQSEQRHGSNANDPNFGIYLRTLSLGGVDPPTYFDPGFGLMGLESDDNMPTHLGAMDDFQHDRSNAASATNTNSSHSASMTTGPNGLPYAYQQPWPMVTSAPMAKYEHVAFQPGPWFPVHEQQQQQQHQQQLRQQPPLSFGVEGHEGLGIHMPSTSHPQHDMHFGTPFDHDSPIVQYMHDTESTMPSAHPTSYIHDTLFADEDVDDREASADPADPCYAQLLYQCLKEAPDHTLSLRELYDWVQKHSQKAKDPKNRGWQNSVRHNLSMNAAFTRVPNNTTSSSSSSSSSSSVSLPKKGSLWRLTDEALRDGVISTTRYRKDPKRKPDHSRRTAPPALNRQTSGAKGGRATRDATRARQARERERARQARYSPYRSSSPPGSGVVTPTSPYFPFAPGPPHPFGLDLHMPTSAPQTPPEYDYHLATFHQQPKAPPLQQPLPTFDDGGPFDFLPLDMAHGGLFGNSDPEMQTPTPSLMTEEESAGGGGGGGRWTVRGDGGSALLPPSSVLAREGEGADFKY